MGEVPLKPAIPWEALRAFTTARVALGRTGSSLPTDAVLAFDHAHARAKDAVAATFDPERLRTLQTDLERVAGVPVLNVSSLAETREAYLSRPDLGRSLRTGEAERLVVAAAQGDYDIVVIVGDGLSAAAPAQHAAPPFSGAATAFRTSTSASTRADCRCPGCPGRVG